MYVEPVDSNKAPDVLAVFVLDTSATMHQYFDHEMSCFDAAKRAIKFMLADYRTYQQKYPDVQTVIVTYGTCPIYIQSRNTEDPHFRKLFKKIEKIPASDDFNIKKALKAAYEYILLFRIRYGIEKPGEGRIPYNKTKSFLCWLTGSGPPTVSDIKGLSIEGATQVHGTQYLEKDFFPDMKMFIYRLNYVKERDQYTDFLEEYASNRGAIVYHLSKILDLRTCISDQTKLDYTFDCRRSNKLVDATFTFLVNFEEYKNPANKANYFQSLILFRNNHENQFPLPFPDTKFHDNSNTDWIRRSAIPALRFEKKNISRPEPDCSLPIDVFIVSRCHMTDEFNSLDQDIIWPVYAPNENNNTSTPPIYFGYLAKSYPNFRPEQVLADQKLLSQPNSILYKHASNNEVYLIVLGYNYNEMINLTNNLQMRSCNLTQELKNDFGDFVIKAPSYYRRYYEYLFAQRLGIELPQFNKINFENTKWYKKVCDCIQMAINEYHHRKYHFSLKGRKKVKPEKLKFVDDLSTVPRNEMLSTLYREKLLFNLILKGIEPPEVYPDFPYGPNRISLPGDQATYFDDEKIEASKLRNPFESDEEARKRREYRFGNLYKDANKGLSVRREPIPEIRYMSHKEKKENILDLRQVRQPRKRTSISSMRFDTTKLPLISGVNELENESDCESDASSVWSEVDNDDNNSLSEFQLENNPTNQMLFVDEVSDGINKSVENEQNIGEERTRIQNKINDSIDTIQVQSVEVALPQGKLIDDNGIQVQISQDILPEMDKNSVPLEMQEVTPQPDANAVTSEELEPISIVYSKISNMIDKDCQDQIILNEIQHVITNPRYNKSDKILVLRNTTKKATKKKREDLKVAIDNIRQLLN